MERWEPFSYLFRKGDRVYLSAVQAKVSGAGYLRDLVAGIEQAGLRVAVPNPLSEMTAILKHYGFMVRWERHAGTGEEVDVWERA